MKKILALFLAFILLVTTANHTFAAFGAGNTKNWPETIYGAKGKVLTPEDKLAPVAYTTGDTITLHFEIENPENNTQTISHELFLHIWKVENIDANKQTFTEDKLAQNHNENADSQSRYHTIALEQLVLAPGESSEFEESFTILDPGYYQFDLTDEDGTRGHIYAAGFIRVKSPTDAGVLAVKTSDTNSFWKKVAVVSGIALVLLALLFFLWKKRRKPQPTPQVQPRRYFYS
jgi:hypothetical protein